MRNGGTGSEPGFPSETCSHQRQCPGAADNGGLQGDALSTNNSIKTLFDDGGQLNEQTLSPFYSTFKSPLLLSNIKSKYIELLVT